MILIFLSNFMTGSYGPSMTGTVLLGLWVLSQLISSCYTFTWDVKMDWGLLDKNAGENKFLREETVYRYRVRFLPVIMFYVFLKIIEGQSTPDYTRRLLQIVVYTEETQCSYTHCSLAKSFTGCEILLLSVSSNMILII